MNLGRPEIIGHELVWSKAVMGGMAPPEAKIAQELPDSR
jgi:hypothetical protein